MVDVGKVWSLTKDFSVIQYAILNRPDRRSISHCPTFPHIGKKAEKTRKTRHLWSCWPTAEVKKPEGGFVQNESNVKTFRKCASNTSMLQAVNQLEVIFRAEQIWTKKNHCNSICQVMPSRHGPPWKSWDLIEVPPGETTKGSRQIRYLRKRDEHLYKQVSFPSRLQHWAFDFPFGCYTLMLPAQWFGWEIYVYHMSVPNLGYWLGDIVYKTWISQQGPSIHRREIKRTSSTWKKKLFI